MHVLVRLSSTERVQIECLMLNSLKKTLEEKLLQIKTIGMTILNYFYCDLKNYKVKLLSVNRNLVDFQKKNVINNHFITFYKRIKITKSYSYS